MDERRNESVLTNGCRGMTTGRKAITVDSEDDENDKTTRPRHSTSGRDMLMICEKGPNYSQCGVTPNKGNREANRGTCGGNDCPDSVGARYVEAASQDRRWR